MSTGLSDCRRNWLRKTLALGFMVCGAALVLTATGSAVQAAEKVPIPGEGQTCAACHAEAAEAWAKSVHRRTVGAPQVPEARQGCSACHVRAAEHLADVTDETKRPSLAGLSGDQMADICVGCHAGGQQIMWRLSAHARTEDGCLTCHDPHGGAGTSMLKALEPELCRECHPGQVADGLLPSHHPIDEGKMVCTDCHNVHGDERGNLPGASTGEMCYRCHGEKEGPFVYEHPPVTEDCATCHKPHGSQNDYLLVQDQPMLCLQCHPGHSDGHRTPLVSLDPDTPAGVAEAQAAIVGFYGNCTSCHSRIHGADLPSGTEHGTFMPGAPLQPASSASAGVAAASMDPSLWGFSEVEFGRIDEDGNQTYVREYDGRNYDVPAPRISVTKFGPSDDFSLEITDLARGDEDIRLRFGNPMYDVQVHQSGLTHRLGRYDDIAAAADMPGATVEPTDESGGKSDYEIDRTTLDVRVAGRCPKLRNVKWMLNHWREAEHGSQQFLYLERCESCHKIQTTEPIDRTTTVTEGGVEIGFSSGAVRYLRQERKFSNRAPEAYNDFPGSHSVFSGSAPLFGVANTKTSGDDLRGAVRLGERLSAAALWRSKERDNRLGNGEIDIRSGGGGVAWRGSQDLTVSASFVGRSLDVERVINGVSRDRDTSRVNLRYTGLPGSTLTFGYTKEKVDREGTGDAHVPLASDSDIWRASLVSRVAPRARLQVGYRATDTDTEGFFDPAAPPDHFPSRLLGLPQDERNLSSVLSYSLSDRMTLSGMHSRRDSTYEVSVPALGVAREAEEDSRTTGAQLVHNVSRRARVSAGYYRQSGETRANSTYGTGDYTMEPPDVPVDTVFPPIEGISNFEYDASVGTVDAFYWATSRLRLFGRYLRSETDGEEVLYEIGDYLDQDPDLDGVAMIFNPFDIEIVDRWIGVSYLLNSSTEVALSHQRRSWDNPADATQDGSYDTWRLGLRKEF